MSGKVVLVTNVTAFAGPGALDGLAKSGARVIAQDPSFSSADTREEFQEQHGETVVTAQTDPAALIEEAVSIHGRLDALVSNDVFPAIQTPSEEVDIQAFHQTLNALVIRPFDLARAALPHFRKAGGGSIVLVTSCRMDLPIPGGALPDSARAAANAMMKSLSVEFAPDQVTVNAVAPNYLYSEAYYPREVYIDSQEGRDYIASQVPAGRLGTPKEIGELIAFLALMDSRFLTGARIDFSGAWPAAPQRLS